METFYKIFEIVGMLICFLCCASVMNRKPSGIQQKLLLTCIWGFVATVGNVFEVFASSPEAAMVGIKIAYIGKCYIVTSALMFVSSYSSVKLPRGLVQFLAIANTGVLATVVTCERHSLFYTAIHCEMCPGGRAAMHLEHGLFYFVWMGLVFLGAGMYLIIAKREMKRESRIAKLRMTMMFWAVAMPMIFEIAFLVLQPTYFDPSTLAVTIVEIFFLFAVMRYGLLDTIELAQERIVEETRDGVIVIDNTGSVILYQNQVAEKFLKRMTELNSDFDVEMLINANESVYELDDRHYEFRVSNIMQKKGSSEIQGYVAWIFDMTFIDEYTSEMIRLKEDAERANRAKTDFLANISHEIRTPMNSIVGYAELALQTHDENTVYGYLKRIKQSSHILLHLINELIDITKIESGRMKLVKTYYRFTDLIDEIRHMMEIPAGRAGLAFMIQVDSELPEYFYDDKVKVQEIIMNLVTNSIKYTQKGHVILKVHLKEIVDKRALINIEVEDTGVGMNETDGEQMFAKFERVDRKKNYNVQGSGLGLPIVKSFVDMMDGTISYESEPGKGTRFMVDIWQELDKDESDTKRESAPTAEPELSQAGEADAESENENENANNAENAAPEEIMINSGHVLIVDDNLLNLEVASGIMELMGMTTRITESGKECLEILAHGEKPDIIFLDYMMPEMDGVETMRHIRALDGSVAKTPIILLTANAVVGVKEEMMDEGFDDFLSKPIEIEELRRILLRFLGQKGGSAAEGEK